MSRTMKRHRFTNSTGIITLAGCASGGRYKSQLEKEAFIRMFLTAGVDQVRMQEPCISYRDCQGKNRKYTADMRVTFEGHSRPPLIVEVKYQRELDAKPELVEKLTRVAAAFAQRGFAFHVMTDREIKAPGLEMMKFVFGYYNEAIEPAQGQIMQCMKRFHSLTLDDLLSAVAGDNLLRRALVTPSVWRLVAHGQLVTDFTKILNETAIIRLPAATHSTAITNQSS